MRKQRAFQLVIFAGLILACLQTAALGQTNDGKFANMTGGGSSLRWDLAVANGGVTLNISAPDGRIFHREFKAGTSPEINLSDRQFGKAAGRPIHLRFARHSRLISGRQRDA